MPDYLSWTVGLLFAAIGGSSYGGLAFISAFLLSGLVVLFPLLGVTISLLIRQIIDCFWASPVISIGGTSFDAKSIAGILVPFAIVTSIAVRRQWLPWRAPWTLISIYVVVSLLAVPFAPYRGEAVNYFARIAFPFAFLALGMMLGRSHRKAIFILVAVSLYAFVAVASGLLQAFGVLAPAEGAVTRAGEITRITGLYHHPLDLALRCSVSLPFALLIFSLPVPARFRMWGALWSVLLLTVTSLTLVRSALIAIAVQILTWVLLTKARVLAPVAATTVLLGAIIVPNFRAVVREAVRPIQEGSIYELGSGRALIFAAQYSAFVQATPQQKLLGRGLGTSAKTTVEYNPLPTLDLAGPGFEEGQLVAHNQVLRVLGESGIVGLLGLGGIVLWCLVRTLRLATGEVDPIRRLMGRSGVVLLAGLAVFSLSSVPFDAPSITWPTWLSLGAILAPNEVE